jgi:hypothetical protein
MRPQQLGAGQGPFRDAEKLCPAGDLCCSAAAAAMGTAPGMAEPPLHYSASPRAGVKP